MGLPNIIGALLPFKKQSNKPTLRTHDRIENLFMFIAQVLAWCLQPLELEIRLCGNADDDGDVDHNGDNGGL